jgi:hypothetical protein
VLELAPVNWKTSARPQVVAQLQATAYRQVTLSTRLPVVNETRRPATRLTLSSPALADGIVERVLRDQVRTHRDQVRPPRKARPAQAELSITRHWTDD